MTRKAVVASVNERWINLLSLNEVENDQKECSGSSACYSCGCQVSGRPFKAANPEELEIKVGDTVEVKADSTRILGASILVLGLPIGSSIAVWLTITRLIPTISEALSAAGAAAGLIAGAAIVFYFGGKRRNQRLPRIITVAK